jgi:hypothetical protein
MLAATRETPPQPSLSPLAAARHQRINMIDPKNLLCVLCASSATSAVKCCFLFLESSDRDA